MFGFLEKSGVASGILIFIGAAAMMAVGVYIVGGTNLFGRVNFIFTLMPLWLPLLMTYLFFNQWVEYVRRYWVYKNGGMLLEIKVPQEVMKSPQAMEFLLIQIYQIGSIDNWLLDTYWNGKSAPYFSLEIASFEGQIHFYIWTFPRYKNMIETHLYAHYPGIEVIEVEDYAKRTVYDHHNDTLFGIHFNKKRPMHESAIPILTYIDFGLDEDPKEEFKHDPIASTIEFFGAIGKGEQMWMQILIQGDREEGFEQARLHKVPDWRKAGLHLIDELLNRDPKTKLGEGAEEGKFAMPVRAPFETDQVKAIERNISKFGFKAMIRAVYLAENEHQKLGIQVPGIIAALRQYESRTGNGIGFQWGTDLYWPWQDYKGRRLQHMKHEVFDAYKRRSVFEGKYKNFHPVVKVWSTEELATVFHLPGSSVTTPTLERIGSARVEAPSNLPTGTYNPRR